MKFVIRIEKIEDVKKFVHLASKCDDEILVGQDSFTVSGKSIMGLFSLDLSKIVVVTYPNRDFYLLLREEGFEPEVVAV